MATYRAYFVDSSALVRRYVQETGTAWVRRLTRHSPSTSIYVARITVVEVTSAIARRRKGTPPLAPSRASSLLRRFRHHLDGRYTLIEITPALLNEAARLANTHTIARLMQHDPSIIYQIDDRKWEEIIAGAYKRAGFDEVILTPRSGNHGRDVIAVKRGLWTVRIIDQVKA